MLKDLEAAYLAETDPVRQSGFGGGHERWRKERGLILTAVDRDGDFLDIGCANGYLVECLCRWANEKGITLEPYGVDIGTDLIALARKRLPSYASHFWARNAWEWIPPRRFRFVYTLTDLVPQTLLKDFLMRVMAHYVEDQGTLIVGGYGSTSQNIPAPDITGILKCFDFPVIESAIYGDLPVSHVAWVKAQHSGAADTKKPCR